MRTISKLGDLAGRKAIVTGGAGHIGSAVAETLTELGADLILCDRDATVALARAESLSGGASNVDVLAFDLTDLEAAREGVREATKRLGGLDILVHCAAMVAAARNTGWSVPFEQQTVDAWEEAISVDLTAAFAMTQEARVTLAESGHGSIILFASIYGFCGPDMKLYDGTNMGNPAGYGVSKAGILQLNRYLATMLAPRVRVNAISPGGVSRNQPAKFVDRYNARTPMERMATEEDIKGAVAYLASDLSAYVTGHNLVVDGGWSTW